MKQNANVTNQDVNLPPVVAMFLIRWAKREWWPFIGYVYFNGRHLLFTRGRTLWIDQEHLQKPQLP